MWGAVSSSSRSTHLIRLWYVVALTHYNNTDSHAFPQHQDHLSSPFDRHRVKCEGYPHMKQQSDLQSHDKSPLIELTNEIVKGSLSSSYELMPMPERGALPGHAIFGTLCGETMIERYQIWKRKDQQDESVVIGIVTFGSHLNGHPSIVHGGIVSLLFDDVCGFAYEALGVNHAVTANLKIDYRAPVPAGSTVRLAVQLQAREGRKLYWKSQMTSLDEEILFAEATSLYIIPRSAD